MWWTRATTRTWWTPSRSASSSTPASVLSAACCLLPAACGVRRRLLLRRRRHRCNRSPKTRSTMIAWLPSGSQGNALVDETAGSGIDGALGALGGCAFCRPSRGTKETMQSCPLYLHVVSSVQITVNRADNDRPKHSSAADCTA